MNFPITGTFIDEVSLGLPSPNWSNRQWADELDYMKKFGLDTLVFIRGGVDNKTNYPSKYFPTYRKEEDDLVGFILGEAAKRDMKVFIGMYMTDLCWGNGDSKTEIEKNKIFIKETMERYGDCPAFYGWYIPHEVGRNILNITDIFSALSYMCKEVTPEKKVLISPFFHSRALVKDDFLTPEQNEEEWNEIFDISGRNIDICAIQDGSAPFSEMADFFASSKRACDAHNISLWQNAESFDREIVGSFHAIPFEIMKRRLEIVKPYVEKVITFDFSHFMSPQAMFISSRNLGNVYYEYYKNR